MMIFFEALAVIFALAYLYFAMKQNIICWYAAFLSTSIYIFLYWDVSLYMESLLNFYYLTMAVYGWRQWNKRKKEKYLSITVWSMKEHVLSLIHISEPTRPY